MTNTLAATDERPVALDPHSRTHPNGRWQTDALQPSDFTTPEDQFGDARRIVDAAGVPGIKAGMDLRGMSGGLPRLPLLAASREERESIRRELARLVDAGVVPDMRC